MLGVSKGDAVSGVLVEIVSFCMAAGVPVVGITAWVGALEQAAKNITNVLVMVRSRNFIGLNLF